MRECRVLHGEFHFIFFATGFYHRVGVDCGVGLIENFLMAWDSVNKIP